ncbi:MAG TPA: ornithine carbamoyltransferase, partial [Bacteroidota bacterium]
DFREILNLSKRMKKNPKVFYRALEGQSLAMIFEKQSLRTHVTFDVAIEQLGAHAIFLTQADISLGKRESIHDVAKNLERWVHGIVVRTFSHDGLKELANYAKVPVINALTDFEHPCQAVGDFLTIEEKLGTFKGKRFAFVGDGNNVCHSLMLLAAKLGMNFVAVTPRGYLPDEEVVKMATKIAAEQGSAVEMSHIPREGVRNADVIYTDVWTSMGQEAERDERASVFRDFQVNAALMKYAKPSAIFMHCLPAHRGEEVTDEVMDSAQSVVFDEAENRLHTEKAIVYILLRNQNREKNRTDRSRRKLAHPNRTARNNRRTNRKRTADRRKHR